MFFIDASLYRESGRACRFLDFYTCELARGTFRGQKFATKVGIILCHDLRLPVIDASSTRTANSTAAVAWEDRHHAGVPTRIITQQLRFTFRGNSVCTVCCTFEITLVCKRRWSKLPTADNRHRRTFLIGRHRKIARSWQAPV